jgi:hypothetical protein
MYIKGLQSSITPSTVHDGVNVFASAWTVGKVNVDLAADGGIGLLGMPMSCGMASEVFLGQLGDNELTLLPRTGTGLNYIAAFSDRIVGPDFSVDPTIGFWMRNPGANPVTVTFVGDLVKTQGTDDLEVIDLTGNPIAIPFDANSLGVDGDVVMPQAGSGLDYFTKTSGSWGPNFPTVGFKAGFWYKYSAGNRRWNIDPIPPSAVIEQY